MKNISSDIIGFINRYKFLLILGFPLVLILVLIIIAPQPSRQDQDSDTKITPTIAKTNTRPSNQNNQGTNPIAETSAEIIEEENLDERPGLLNKKELNNNTTEYTFTSDKPNRPDLVIAEGNAAVLFERDVARNQYPTRVSDYTSAYGQPERIIEAPAFYGSTARTYIYAQNGIAFIANPQTQEVYEQHLFPEMTVEEYMQRYSKL
jgi:uncharacterized membrane protein YdfJ with MMPL/SSD domain